MSTSTIDFHKYLYNRYAETSYGEGENGLNDRIKGSPDPATLVSKNRVEYTAGMSRRSMPMPQMREKSSRSVSLFPRLMLYFLAVMLIPVSLLGFAYFTAGNRTIVNNLTEQGEINIFRAANGMRLIIEDYRHKAYAIGNNERIIAALEADDPRLDRLAMTGLYEQLFDIMKGDTYLATASVVSSTGRTRLSTHLFPERYDLRYHGNDTNPFFDLSRAGTETASMITMHNRYTTQNNAFVFLNILRRVRNSDGHVVGYVAVDVYQDAVGNLADGLVFSDLLLIDTENYVVSSLIHTERHGDFSRFPELAALTFPFESKSYVSEGTIVSTASIPNTPLVLAGITDTTIFQQNIEGFFLVIVLIMVAGTCLAALLAYFFSRSIARPVNRLASSMYQVESGNLAVRVPESRILEIGQLERSFNAMVTQITSLLVLTREEEAKLREAERKALEAQMNPHFLYNTLNTVKAIAKLHGEQEILTITTRLGKLLRNAIDNRDADISLRESFSLVESYLTIQRIRFGEKLRTIVELDERIADVRTPKLLIQPLVENALIHGLEPKTGVWRLTVRGELKDKGIIITVADNGVGIPGETASGNLEDSGSTDHVGLSNIHRRLHLRYGSKGRMFIDSKVGEGTLITILIPHEPSDSEPASQGM